MTHALVTIVAPLDPRRVVEAESRIDELGNPARPDVRKALDRLDGADGTHFCSLHAIRSTEQGRAYLLFEFSADGGDEEATARIARAIGPELGTVFSLASDWKADGDVYDYLVRHRISTGVGFFESPGAPFIGTPGMTVGRITSERDLAAKAAEALAGIGGQGPALDRVREVRRIIGGDPALSDMLETGTPLRPYVKPGTPRLVATFVASFLGTFLWPVLLAVALFAVFRGVMAAAAAHGFWPGARAFAAVGLDVLFWDGLAALGLTAIGLVLLYFELRSVEDRDSIDGKAPDPKVVDEIFERENHCAQNHMISLTQRKPGALRLFTLRLVLWAVGILATRFYRPGSLSEIRTIHFARWVTVPGTRDLLFLSNYGGSWESYLEDFITRAHGGLTGVWSNTIGFPRTENLIQKGATDGERFKRFARRSMLPTRFWYSAYPRLTTAQIRSNADVRLGLSGVQTEDEAVSWLALFGSAARPPSKLISSEIQSIIFGGLGKQKPEGSCLLYDLPDDVGAARAWLAAVLPDVGLNDGRRLSGTAVVSLALGPEGLLRLGLPADGAKSFPYAFLTGMANESRKRILGDTGANDWRNWSWGSTAPHAALLVYGDTAEDVAAMEAKVQAAASARSLKLVRRVQLLKVEEDRPEPFGFMDGISQPLIKGTYKALRSADPIHLVEPGEFILGYPDGRGNTPPGPTIPAAADPSNILPLVEGTGDFSRNFVNGTRDIGRNGSFLVIRQLEQDTAAFRDYCVRESAALQGRLPEPYEVTPEFIAAKLIGRWQNGSSLARHPYKPKKAAHKKDQPEHDHDRGAIGPAETTERPAGGGPSVSPSDKLVDPPAVPSRDRDNDFLLGTEDPEALRCPFGAHIRRANPRDSLDPGVQDQIDITNRHRIIRVGRQYKPEEGEKPGLFFMCLNGDIERQFEFVQQTWLGGSSFHGLTCENDPVTGGAEESVGFSIPTRYGPIRLPKVPAVVTTKGGGYFFLPGKRLLEFLSAPL